MMVRIIGIAGSPRKRGNSTSILHALLTGATSVGAASSIVYLDDLMYRGCKGCVRCSPKNRCVISDALSPVMASLLEADIWVFASPIYYDGVSGQMKMFFDRCRWFSYVDGMRKSRLNGRRRAAIIVTYEDKRRDDYYHEAEKLAYYLSWMGDFGDVRIIAEGELGPVGAVAERDDIIEEARMTGVRLVESLSTTGADSSD